jgi:hypothetical protein
LNEKRVLITKMEREIFSFFLAPSHAPPSRDPKV